MNNPNPSNPDKNWQLVPYQGTNRELAASPHEPVAGSILPVRYPVVFDQTFWDTFATDPVALPPSHLRIPYWRHTEGAAEWQRRRQQAAAQNNEAMLRYERLVSDIEIENQCIVRCNQQDLAAYKQEEANYQRKFADYQEALELHERKKVIQRERTEARLRKKLEHAIDKQTPILKEILVDIARRARRKTAISLLFVVWCVFAMIYAWVYVHFPYYIALPALPLVLLSFAILDSHRQRIAEWKSDVGYTTYGDDHYQSKYTFWLRDVKYVAPGQRGKCCVFTPVYFPLTGDTLLTTDPEREPHPLGTKEDNYHTRTSEDPLFPPGDLPQLFLSCIPGISVIVMLSLLCEMVGEIFVVNALTLQVDVAAIKRKSRLLQLFYRNLSDSDVVEYLERNTDIPQPPASVAAPCSRPLKQKPALPKLVEPVMPEPPAEYLLDGPEGDYSRTLKGAVVYTAEENRRLARHAVFADNQVRHYFCFGDMPVPFYDGESPHMVLMGTTGSGKTTLFRMLMSALLPLTRSQAERIVRQSPDLRLRKPSSSHEWSRSFTHQAIVYDAKNEAVQQLKAFGFNEESDLIILEPSNPKCSLGTLPAT